MKTLTKNKLVAVLLLAFIVLISGIIVFPKPTVSAQAVSPLSDWEVQAQLEETITTIEEELAGKNTDVITELYNQKAYYENKLMTATGNEIEKITNLIDSSQNMIVEYETYLARKSSIIQPVGSFHILYTPAVSAIIAGFYADALLLSAELLTYMMDNDIPGSNYIPTNGSRMQDTTLIKDELAYNNEVVGSASFPKLGVWGYLAPSYSIAVDCDGFNSLGSFTYQKQYYDSARVKINIKDKYDFDPGKSGLLKICYQAQEAGVLVPFYTVIKDIIVSGTVPFDHEIQNNEAVVTGIGHFQDNITIPAMIRQFGAEYQHPTVDNHMPPLNVRIGNSSIAHASLKNINLTESWIGDFKNQIDETGLTRNIISIGNSAFYGCSGLTSIMIPSSVTSIGSNAFGACSGLINITIPNGVTRIEDGTFNNCSNLTTLSSLINIVYIGTEAFKGCNSLTNISLPAGLISIGEQAFKGCNNLNISVSTSNPNYSAEENILYNKSKTRLVAAGNVSADVTIPNTVTEISPYAFEGNSNLNSVHIKNSPTIGQYAFANCENLNSVYFDSYTLPTIGTNGFSNNNFALYVPYVTQGSYRNSFATYTNNINSISAQITFISDDTTIGTRNVYFGSIIDNLIEPVKTGYDFCGWYDNSEFNGLPYQNGELWETQVDLSLYGKWKPKQFYITFAGEGSNGLPLKMVKYNSIIGELPSIAKSGYSFFGWKSQSGQYYDENTTWVNLDNITLTSDLRANEYTITYDGNGGIPEKETKSAVYDSVIDSLASCQRTGYTFLGWNTSADGNGQAIEAPFIYNINNDVTLYAQWKIIEYSITYNLNKGTQASINPTIYTILSDYITFSSPSKTGYRFIDWKNGESVITGIPTGSHGDINIEAFWDANKYTVTLDPNRGEYSGENPIIVTYDSSFSISSTPTRTGYTFEGWYDNENVKCVAASGGSTEPWNKEYDTTLLAHWAIKSYEIQINNDGSITWLGASGLSSVPCSIEYGTVLSSINLIAIFKQSDQGYKEGQIFDHFEYDRNLVDWKRVPDLGDNDAVITIIPVWVNEKHSIYFYTHCPETIPPLKDIEYGTIIELPSNVNNIGKSFKGWYTSEEGGTKIEWDTMHDLTINEQRGGSTWLHAQYDLIQYTVTYFMDGGINSPNNPSKYNIESIITFNNPTKIGYLFNGWFKNANKTNPIIELRNDNGNKDIYAKWSPITYTVRYNSNYGTNTTIDVTHTYNAPKNLRANTFTKTGYNFAGWAKSSTGSIVYTNSKYVNNLTTTNNTIINLYAKWNVNTYSIKYCANGGSGTMEPSVHTYDTLKNLNENTFTKKGYNFAGWATTENGIVVYSNSHNVSKLTTTQSGSVYLYAKWTLKTYTITFDMKGGKDGSDGTTAFYGEKLPLIFNDKTERTSKDEFLQYKDIANVFDNYGLVTYTISFDIKAPVSGSVFVYQQNGSEAKYSFGQYVNVTTSYNRRYITVTPTLANSSLTQSWLAFYGTYGSGRIVTVKNVKIELGSIASSFNETIPTKTNYVFQGYYEYSNGGGRQYYDSDMTSPNAWNKDADGTVYAYWTPVQYSITYKNLYDCDYSYRSSWMYLNPYAKVHNSILSYKYGEGADLKNTYAKFYDGQTKDNYVITPLPYKFLGWYTDMSFSTSKSSISESEVGDITLYAKWELEYSYHRTEKYKITDSGRFNQSFGSFHVGLNNLRLMGFKNLTIKFDLRVWEEYDGWQGILLYSKYEKENYNTFWEKELDTSSDSNYRYRSPIIILKVDDYKDMESLYILFGARGAGRDDWYNQDLNVTITIN